jgi:hypothetical protein
VSSDHHHPDEPGWDPVAGGPGSQPGSEGGAGRALPPHERPLDERPVHTADLPDTPTRDRSIPATAWVEAPADLLALGDDLPDPSTGGVARYLRRIGPWLLWRAGPARGADARYWAALADDLGTSFTFDLFPDGSGSGRGPTSDHVRFRTWKEDLRDHVPPG